MKFLALFICLFASSCAHQSKTTYTGHGADSVSEKLLKKFAPKPIAFDQLERIESLLDVRSPGMGILSPDGKDLFFSWNVSGNDQIWKSSKNSKFPVQMTGGQDRASLSDVTPDGKYLVLTRDLKGNEYPYLYIQSTSGGELKLISGKEKTISSPQFVSKDSRFLYYTINDQRPTQRDLYKYDFRSGKKEKVLKGIKGYMFVADFKPNGKLLIGNAKGNTAREYYLFDERSKKLSPLLGQDENEEYSVKFGRNDGEYIVQTNKFGEYRRLYKFKSGKFKPISAKIKYNVEHFSIDPGRSRILYTINRDGYTDLGVMSARTFKTLPAPFKRKNGILHVVPGSTTSNSRYTVFGVATAKSPSSSYVYNWKTGSKIQWVKPSSPEVDTSKFVEPSLEHYTAKDGTKIPMFVSRPNKCTKKSLCPVVVNFHGGPEAQSKPHFSAFVQLFLEEGFVFVQPNVRGSNGYSKAWLNADNGPKRLDVISDIEDAAVFIKKNWSVGGRSPKVGVMGGSYGGYSTNIAMTMFAGTYDAGVSIVGMSSLVTFLENTGPYRKHLRTTEYGDPEKDLDALIKLSPVTYLDKIEDPLLIVHGATDPRVPAGEAIQIYNAMKKKGLDGELILFPDEGHGVRKRKNSALYMGHTLNFFKKHLKN